jgi:hypothetical protein
MGMQLPAASSMYIGTYACTGSTTCLPDEPTITMLNTEHTPSHIPPAVLLFAAAVAAAVAAAAAAVPTHFKVSLRASLTSDIITACMQQATTRKQTQVLRNRCAHQALLSCSCVDYMM